MQPSFISECLEGLSEYQDKEDRERMIENVCGMLIAGNTPFSSKFLLASFRKPKCLTLPGGADTSVTAVKTFIAVLLLHPDIQAKAQAEIDAVIGPNRLPDFEDKPKLPYLNAMLKETLRWEPVTPMGMPHMSTEDDIYQGYFIPKGSIVTGNTW